MKRPLLIDLYCGAGGASRGYHDAGFDVIGVDLYKSPRYPYPFLQGDVTLMTPSFLSHFDAIHASPPCQAHTSLKTMHNARPHLDLIPPTRAMLRASGKPWIMENVVGAPLIDPVTLCGTMFRLGVDDADLRRHRIFEASFPISAPGPCQHGARSVIGVYGGHVRNRTRARTLSVNSDGARDSRRKFDKGVPDFTIGQGREAMGIDWMTAGELSQAIPPAYTRHLGAQMMEQIRC